MPCLTMTYGLPASGKSSWATAQVIASCGQTKRYNKDLAREMIDANEWSKNNEKEIVALRDLLAERWLRAGYNVIIDDTNLHPKHEVRLREIASDCKASFKIHDFSNVTVEECIRRDLQRNRSVGEKVIRSQWKQFLFKAAAATPAPKFVPYAPNALIVDIDGTVAKMHNRGPHDYAKVSQDLPNGPVIRILETYVGSRYPDLSILFVSGRPELCREDTERWINQEIGLQAAGEVRLFMRPTWMVDPKSGKEVRDYRKDYVIKREIYEREIEGKYNVLFCLDDRDQTVQGWRDLGLTCLQVAPGDF